MFAVGSCQNGEILWSMYANVVNEIKNTSFSLLFFNVINITIVTLKNGEVSKMKTKNRLLNCGSRCLGSKSLCWHHRMHLPPTSEHIYSQSVDKADTWGVCVCVCPLTQSCPTLCDPIDCSQWGSSVHEIFQARILEWVAISFSSGTPQPRDQICDSYFSCIGRWILYH